MTELDDEKAQKKYCGWNARDNKKPMALYCVLILVCLVLAWVLSSTGH